jgi:8-oxo-dGTP pyrophosphatase MutT (NUDIX family)
MSDPLADVPLSWPVTGTDTLYDGEWVVTVRRDHVHRPGHPEDTFGRLVVDDPGAVVVLALDEHDRVVVLRQYRHPVRMRLIELPAGKLDKPGEDALVAARRELLEETGLAAEEWTHLMTTYASPGITSETHAMFLARGLSEVEHDFERHHEEADMTVERVGFAELVEAIFDGRVADAPLVTAVLAVEALRTRGTL